MREKPVCSDALIKLLTNEWKLQCIQFGIQMINTCLLCEYKCVSVHTGDIQELTAVENMNDIYTMLYNYRLCHIQLLLYYRNVLYGYI